MYFLFCETTPSQYHDTILNSPVAAAAHAAAALQAFASADQELLIAIPLNVRHQPAEPMLITAGGQSFAQADAKVLFRRLLTVQAAGFILAHNHPSGDPNPSPEDIALTAKIGEAGEILDIQLLDHIVLGAEGSFRSIRDIIKG